MRFLPNTVINLHAVYDADWIEKALLLLQRNYDVVPVETLEKFYYSDYRLRHACHITFDDGDRSFYELVYPLLLKYKIPVSIYVSPLATQAGTNFWFQEIRSFDPDLLRKIIEHDYPEIGQLITGMPLNACFKSLSLQAIWGIISKYREQSGCPVSAGVNMNASELQEIQASGLVSIGAHTQNHPILANEDDAGSSQEINSSIRDLSDLLGHQVKYFAYPNGIPGLDFGPREMHTLEQNGIKLAFSTQNKGFNKRDNTLSIPRNGMSRGSSTFLLFKLLSGRHWDLLKSLLQKDSELACRHKIRKF